MAERLIALAAGAVFVVAPVAILTTGAGLPGTYGSAVAVALTFLAIPVLALGWIAMSRSPWTAGVAALACWSALAGSLAGIYPILAAAAGLVAFLAARDLLADRILPQVPAAPVTEAEAEQDAAGRLESTGITLSRDGTILRTQGYRETVFRPRRLFVDHVHLADRIAFLGAVSDVAKGDAAREVSARINLARAGEAQAFEQLRLTVSRGLDGVELAFVEHADLAAQEDVPDAQGTVAQKRFLATVSHELRTPLNSIIGFSDILRRDLFGALANDRQREYVELIHSSGTHLLSLVNSILDMSKIDAGTYSIHREPFDLNAMAEECVAMLRPQADGIGVTLELEAGDTAEVDADRRAIKQVVLNLLSNAVKFSQKGGVVRMTTALRGQGFVIRVLDAGIGMSPADLAAIGTPFVQADNSYTRSCEGTGLGLAVVKGIVGLHGGTLDIESEPGTGTSVSLYIPRAADDMQGGDHGGTVAKPAAIKENDGQDERQTRTNANAVRLAG